MPHSNYSTQRVLILGESIFEVGIARLLTNGADLDVSCVKYMDDFAFLDDVAQNRPDVIMLNEAIPGDSTHILDLLVSDPFLADLYVIIVRLGNNVVDVYKMPRQAVVQKGYERQQFVITHQDDLVAVVQGDFSRL